MSGLLAAGASASTLDCWPVSKHVVSWVLRTPLNDDGILVVAEDSRCDPEGHPPVMRWTLAGDLAAVPPGPEALEQTVRAVADSADKALSRPGSSRVERVDRTVRVLAGDAAFLDIPVDVDPAACPWMEGEGWTVHTAQYCILDQIGGGVFAPRQAFPGWAGQIPNTLSAKGVPLLDALVQLYTVNGVEPLAFFFLSKPGEADGRPARRISLEVHYAVFPPSFYDSGPTADDPPPTRTRKRIEARRR